MLKRTLQIGISTILVFQIMFSGTNIVWTEEANDTATITTVETEETTANQDTDNPWEGQQVCSDNQLALYIDPSSAVVGIENLSNKKMWYTNPLNPAEEEARAQLKLVYYDQNDDTFTIDSYHDCILNKQFTIENLNNGVQITYHIGKPEDAMSRIPLKLSDARFQSFFLNNNALSSSQQSFIKKRYRQDDSGIWVWKETTSDFTLQNVLEVLNIAEYTIEELAIDNKENGLKTIVTKQVSFTIVLRYIIENGNLLVDVPLSELVIPDGIHLTNLTLLEFFGATTTDDDGYLFIPDGCGALIDFKENQGKELYTAGIYGTDMVEHSAGQADNYYQTVKLPVFGIKNGEESYLAIIEENASYGTINAYKAGRSNSYNAVYADYTIEARDFAAIGGIDNDAKIPVYTKERYKGQIRQRYLFQSAEKAGYEGMAIDYRNYLISIKGMNRLLTNKQLPFLLNTIGAIKKNKQFLWFNYTSLAAATTFEQNQEILDLLKSGGIQNTVVTISGWSKGGMGQQSLNKLQPESVLGGKKQLLSLLEYAKKQNIQVIPEIDLLSMPDGFAKYQQAARTLDQRFSQVLKFDSITGEKSLQQTNRYRITPDLYEKFIQGVSKNLSEYTYSGVYLKDIGENLFADYSLAKVIDRETSSAMAAKSAQKITESGKQVVVSGGNSYMLPYVDIVIQAPIKSSGFRISKNSVPFFQIALHGLIQYSGEAFNFSESSMDEFLYAIATGGLVYYKWAYEDSSFFKNTDYSDLYAVHYKDTLDEAINYYNQSIKVLGGLQNAFISSCSSPSKNFWKTVYEDGTIIYVNINDQPMEMDGIIVAAKSYEVQKEGVK